ncbi:Calcipressin [Rhodofomes roseus]|uniref:Calcipressin n=1 Tax=Rhodofomes roseus TaxID=34475 RepID=A0ABQ8KUW6_9APHY|nr:Calcipressin [Rhodofomes roseus]KAH9842473.1 Calcipressin [Rhodofomes roseus]
MNSTPPARSSPPSLTSNSGPPTPRRTNTLVITQLPATFFEPVVLDALRHHFATYGPVYAWAPLKSFYRIIIVYHSEDDAEHAKESCDHLIVGATQSSPAVVLRVFRADSTTILTPSGSGEGNMYLRPPEHEKNFLISPPGSPPVGWEPIREEPPNPTPLADDLIVALKKLQVQEESRHRGHGPEVLIEPDEDGVGISVYVEDCSGGEGGQVQEEPEEDWVYGETAPARTRWKPVPTALPPSIRA